MALEKIKTAAIVDNDLQDLCKATPNEFPNKKTTYSPTFAHAHVVDERDDMIVSGARVVIGSKVPKMLKVLVRMHQGATKMRARLFVYWPNMDVKIKIAINSCEYTCTAPAYCRPIQRSHITHMNKPRDRSGLSTAI